jgi:hypothetical protein
MGDLIGGPVQRVVGKPSLRTLDRDAARIAQRLLLETSRYRLFDIPQRKLDKLSIATQNLPQ